MFDSTKEWIREKYSQFRGNTLSGEPVEKTENKVKTEEQKFDEAFQSFASFFEDISNNLEKSSHLQKFNCLGESFRKAGYLSGQWGVTERNIASLAEMQILITKNQIEEECLSSQRILESEVGILQEIKGNAERDYKVKHIYYERLNRAYQYSHRQFSWLLGIIYGFFSIVLIIADIPLALELTRRGFNLASDPENPISKLFQYGTNEGFLFNFLKVLMVNWEVVVFATGIAFCTIYIKIFYDDFIGVPLENLIKKSSESPRENYEELHEESHTEPVQPTNDEGSNLNLDLEKKAKVTKRFNRLWWWRFGIKMFVLMILFTSILTLGYFRYSVVSSPDIKSINPNVIFLTYSLLTLLFPIISGICGSLSLNCFHNWREKTKAEREDSHAQRKVLRATDEFRVKDQEKEKNKSFLEWLKNAETVSQFKKYLVSCYEFGFKFGYLHPEWTFGGDLFSRAEALRQRTLIDINDPKKFGIVNGHPKINQPIKIK